MQALLRFLSDRAVVGGKGLSHRVQRPMLQARGGPRSSHAKIEHFIGTSMADCLTRVARLWTLPDLGAA